VRFFSNTPKNNDTSIISVYIRLDKLSSTYTRQVYTVLNFLGDIGGLQSILYIAAFWLVSALTYQLYYRELAQQVIQVDFDTLDKKEKPRGDRKTPKV